MFCCSVATGYVGTNLIVNYSISERPFFVNIWMNIFSLVISLILMALEITLFVGVTSRFVFYGDGAEAFFIIFVYGLTILELILCTRKISKSLYDKNDNIIMLVRPIRSSSIILSNNDVITIKPKIFNDNVIIVDGIIHKLKDLSEVKIKHTTSKAKLFINTNEKEWIKKLNYSFRNENEI